MHADTRSPKAKEVATEPKKRLLPTQPDLSLQERWERLRSHKRIITRIVLLVEWDQGGAKQTANAITVDVSHSGCMAVVGADLPLHQRVRLIRRETGRTAEAEVVWRSHGAWDAGFEFLKPDATFWN